MLGRAVALGLVRGRKRRSHGGARFPAIERVTSEVGGAAGAAMEIAGWS